MEGMGSQAPFKPFLISTPGGVYLVAPRGFWALLGPLGLSWPLLASLGALLGLSWGSLGAFLALLASLWGSLGLSWGSLGALLGLSWGSLGLSGGSLRARSDLKAG